MEIRADGVRVAQHALERVGLFIIEADLPEAETYNIEIAAAPPGLCPAKSAWWTGNSETIRRLRAY